MVGRNREFRDEVTARLVSAGDCLGVIWLDRGNKKSPWVKGLFRMKQGDGLLSHPVSKAVPSVLEGLTSVFGKGTGVSPPLWSPSFFRVARHSLTTEQRHKR